MPMETVIIPRDDESEAERLKGSDLILTDDDIRGYSLHDYTFGYPPDGRD